MTNENIVTYDSVSKVFKIFDIKTKHLQTTIAELDTINGSVKQLALQNQTLIYLKGRNIVIYSLTDKTHKPQIVRRDSNLKALAVNEKASLIAVGDDFGKIYIIHNTK